METDRPFCTFRNIDKWIPRHYDNRKFFLPAEREGKLRFFSYQEHLKGETDMKRSLLKKLGRTLTLTVLALTLAISSASACTTLYVGAHRTDTGTRFVARTEDYGSDMNKLWFISEAGAYPDGTTYLGCPEYGEFEWVFSHDSYRFTYFTNDIFNGACPECGQENPTHLSYTEFGTNEKGVSVSATETISGNAEVRAVDPNVTEKADGKVGIEETDIPTILLAEAASAREALDLLLRIYDEYGAYACSGLFICDQDEVWYVENCSGTQYVALRLNDDLMFLEPNLAVIGLVDLDDTENVVASPRLIEVAQQAGTFVGDAAENQIDFRASYANLGTAEAPRVGQPRLVDGLNFFDAALNCTAEDLAADNTLFTISNVKDGAVVAFYTNIQSDRVVTRNDIFGYYQLSSIGKPSNQEIEIFEIFADRPAETATVGWVAVGNMSYNVFVPYYPLLLNEIYAGYQVSADTARRVSAAEERPAGFGTFAVNSRTGESFYVVYPENWRDSCYFAFEGLGGYIQYAEQIDGAPVNPELLTAARARLDALQDEFAAEFFAMEPADTSALGAAMAQKAHETALELIDMITNAGL